MLPTVDSQPENYFTPFEPQFNTVEEELNSSVDSYMRDIEDGTFINSLVQLPTTNYEPCCSYGISGSFVPDIMPPRHSPIFDTPFSIRDRRERSSSIYLDSPPALPARPFYSETATPAISGEIDSMCVVCKLVSSDAHSCPSCHQSIHTICGQPVDGMEGYGCPVWCMTCLLQQRTNTIDEGRGAAKRGQERQALRMVKQSNKRLKLFDVGENVLIPNLPGVVLSHTGDGCYQIGTAAGRLEKQYTAGQFDLSLSYFMASDDVPNKTVTLREAVLQSSLGRYRQFFSCTGGCVTNKCRCKRGKRTCNSKCHKALTCRNKISNQIS